MEENTIAVCLDNQQTTQQTSAQTTGADEEKSIFGVFSLKDIRRLQDEYQIHHNPKRSLREICEPIFRHYKVRSLYTLQSNPSQSSISMEEDIKTAFYAVQSMVITKNKTTTKTVKHKKGDFRRDSKGEPIQRSDGNGYEIYQRDEKEEIETIQKVPYYDYENAPTLLQIIEKFADGLEVLPDFTELEKRLCAHTDYNRGLEIIRELTKYYVFEEQEKFIERFALLICNAKAKGLNHHPKYPVLFSLVGDMNKGKGWLATMLKQTYDKVFETKSNKTSFKRLFGGNFNGIMLTRGFISFDEKNGLENGQAEEMKTLITEPDVSVQLKYKECMTVRNLATFFSTTNESIKDVMGLQKDRRIVEFVLKDKTMEIPEQQMVEWLTELWEVMPIEHPNTRKVIDELLEESENILTAKMDEIVSTLFENHKLQFVHGEYVNRHNLRQTLKQFGGVRLDSVINWCIDNDILRQKKNGQLYVCQRNLDGLLDRQNEAEKTGGND